MNDPYAHLTPKPLEEQVPGAWNFVEPKPPTLSAESILSTQVGAGKITIQRTTTSRLTLAPEARARLVATGIVWSPLDDREPNEAEWREFEDALADILLPPGRPL